MEMTSHSISNKAMIIVPIIVWTYMHRAIFYFFWLYIYATAFILPNKRSWHTVLYLGHKTTVGYMQ